MRRLRAVTVRVRPRTPSTTRLRKETDRDETRRTKVRGGPVAQSGQSSRLLRGGSGVRIPRGPRSTCSTPRGNRPTVRTAGSGPANQRSNRCSPSTSVRRGARFFDNPDVLSARRGSAISLVRASFCAVAQSVEQVAVNHPVAGSIPARAARARVAQLAERLFRNQEVAGSFPAPGSLRPVRLVAQDIRLSSGEREFEPRTGRHRPIV